MAVAALIITLGVIGVGILYVKGYFSLKPKSDEKAPPSPRSPSKQLPSWPHSPGAVPGTVVSDDVHSVAQLLQYSDVKSVCEEGFGEDSGLWSHTPADSLMESEAKDSYVEVEEVKPAADSLMLSWTGCDSSKL